MTENSKSSDRIRIVVKIPERDYDVEARAYDGDAEVGLVQVIEDTVQQAWVLPAYQGRGLGPRMYDAIEQFTGETLGPGDIRCSPQAIRLWRRRLGKDDRWMIDLLAECIYLQDDFEGPWSEAEVQARGDFGLPPGEAETAPPWERKKTKPLLPRDLKRKLLR